MNHYKQLLFLRLLPGIGNSTINKIYVPLIQKGMEMDEFVREVFSRETRVSEKAIKEAKATAEEKAEIAGKDSEIKIITIFDAEYPKGFYELGDGRPPFFYVKGNADILNKSGIAVIGTRHPGNITKKNGPDIVKKIITASDGKTLISGLALGCDKIGHNAALLTKTPTVAVLPSGFNNISPAPHKKLAESIVKEGGCLLSEYEPDAIVNKYTYIQRDTLTSALSTAVFVLECGVKSGTMHTVNAGFKLNRILAAWNPESQDDGDFAGNMLMIEKYRARPLTTDDDIVAFVAAIENQKETEEISGQKSQSKQSTLF